VVAILQGIKTYFWLFVSQFNRSTSLHLHGIFPTFFKLAQKEFVTQSTYIELGEDRHFPGQQSKMTSAKLMTNSCNYAL